MAMMGVLLWVCCHLQTLSAQEIRTVAPFEAVSASGDVQVILREGTQEKVEVYAEGIDEDQVDIFVRRNGLRIQLLNLKSFRDKDVKVYVTYKRLYGVKAGAGARVYSEGLITTDRLSARAVTGGELSLEVATQSLEAHAGEGAILAVSGSTDTLEVNVSTGGHFEGEELEANRSYVRAGTGGIARVVAREALDASANLGGQIYYIGQPTEKSTRTLLSGEIRKYAGDY